MARTTPSSTSSWGRHDLGTGLPKHFLDLGALLSPPEQRRITTGYALLFQSAVLVLTGELTRAAELAAEEATIERVTGAVPLRHAPLILAAWRGREVEAAQLYAASVAEATGRGGGTEVTLDKWLIASKRGAGAEVAV